MRATHYLRNRKAGNNKMKLGLAFVFACSLAVLEPTIASGSPYILDTGTPTGGSFLILNQGKWFAAEFTATAGETIADLSAYLNQNSGAGTAFTFAIYSDAAGFIGARPAPTPVYTAGATFEADGWNTAAANWTVPTTGDYGSPWRWPIARGTAPRSIW